MPQKNLSSDQVIPFNGLLPQLEPLAGGKGSSLARMYRAGYRVPDGFIILPTAFAGDELTAEAWAQTQICLSHLRRADANGSFAVRSSALSEDSAQASFAGEFETVLDVRTDEEICAAIRTVRCSRHTARVQAYTQAQGLEQADQEIAVVVQRLIRPDYAGVLFTVDPVTGDLTQMTGNFVPGLGEKLVSGHANAQTFTLQRPKGTYSGPPELKRVALDLYYNACHLEKELGSPQDIEWAIAGGRLYILQSRPITTLSGYKAQTAEWNDSLTGNFLWSGTNLSENAPYVLTPFTCSLRKGLVYEGVDFCDSSSMGVDGYPQAGIIGGRGYINLSIQVSASRPFFGGDTRKALQQATAWWGGIPEDVKIPLIPISSWAWWSQVIPSLTRLGIKMARLRKKIPQFVAENPHWCAVMRQRIRQTKNRAELAALLRDEIKPYSIYAFFLTFAGATDLPNRLERELRELVGADDANALLSNLSGLSSQLESLGPLTGLGKVARGEMSRDAYLEAYGHRGENENEYAWPRPLEDPTWLDRQLIEFAKAPVAIEALFVKQRAAYAAAWERFCERYPRKVNSMRRRLEKAAQAACQREAIRSEATRSATVMRAFALRAGELTGVGEDVFFLTMDEVLSLLAGNDSARRFLPARKETHERYCALPPYPTIIVGRFDPFKWAADPNRRSDIYNANAPLAPHSADTADTIQGFAGALGIVEGTVRRLDNLEASDQLQPGEILVTTMTNIGWTPLFPRLAAIITDLGAPLSHAAIVARELGIPAVVGCGDATMRLKTGDRVRVDGGKGLVEVLKHHDASSLSDDLTRT
ncbi:pyruvate, water dikinase [Thermoflexales bacterium]|nr:pyruvate, water dikinase [Thermoflexales bacterium]